MQQGESFKMIGKMNRKVLREIRCNERLCWRGRKSAQ